MRADYVKFSQENFAPHPGDGRWYDRPPERAAQAPVDVQLCPVEQGQHSALHNPPPCPTDLPPLPNLLPSDLRDPLTSSLTINPKPIVTSKLSLTDDVMPNYLSPIQDVIQTNSSPTRLLTNIPSTPFTRTTPSSTSVPSITGHSQNLTLPTLSDPPGQPSLVFTTCKRKVLEGALLSLSLKKFKAPVLSTEAPCPPIQQQFSTGVKDTTGISSMTSSRKLRIRKLARQNAGPPTLVEGNNSGTTSIVSPVLAEFVIKTKFIVF
ncbi:hypothetical protein L1049_025347 [Liquidambar formosana]|uniref:Uncharacterized protein n=1 Tax=Liquidambar formosana TaxID=63359 RepID=A0AAP0N6Z8_LIQFO